MIVNVLGRRNRRATNLSFRVIYLQTYIYIHSPPDHYYCHFYARYERTLRRFQNKMQVFCCLSILIWNKICLVSLDSLMNNLSLLCLSSLTHSSLLAPGWTFVGWDHQPSQIIPFLLKYISYTFRPYIFLRTYSTKIPSSQRGTEYEYLTWRGFSCGMDFFQRARLTLKSLMNNLKKSNVSIISFPVLPKGLLTLNIKHALSKITEYKLGNKSIHFGSNVVNSFSKPLSANIYNPHHHHQPIISNLI